MSVAPPPPLLVSGCAPVCRSKCPLSTVWQGLALATWSHVSALAAHRGLTRFVGTGPLVLLLHRRLAQAPQAPCAATSIAGPRTGDPVCVWWGGLHRTPEEVLRASRQGHHGHRASHRVRTPQAPIAGGRPSAQAGTGASVLPPQVAWEGGGACAVLSGAPRPGGEGGQCQGAGLGPPASGALSWLFMLDVGSTSQQAWARHQRNVGQV